MKNDEKEMKTPVLFSPGTFVTLKSGGPTMTVVGTNENGEVRCAWFNKNDEVQGEDFPVQTLHRVAGLGR